MQDFVEHGLMKYTPLPRGELCGSLRRTTDGMEKRKFVGVLVGLEGGFVH